MADPLFGTNIYLVYINYQNRKFGFDTDFAAYAGGTGAFVPSTTTKFDFRIWSALPDGTNIIDLDKATGQAIVTGGTSTSTGEISVNNTQDGRLIASLATFLPQIPEGSYLTGSAATITVDRYGRVVGFTTPDNFYFSQESFVATSGQTVFTPPARDADYIAGQDLIFQNGVLLDPSDYTETTTDFTLDVGATIGDIVTVISMRAVSSADIYEMLHISVESVATNQIVGDELTFSNSGTPTQ